MGQEFVRPGNCRCEVSINTDSLLRTAKDKECDNYGNPMIPSDALQFRELPCECRYGCHACSVDWTGHEYYENPASALEKYNALPGQKPHSTAWEINVTEVLEPIKHEEESLQLEVWRWPENGMSYELDPHAHILMANGFLKGTPNAKKKRQAVIDVLQMRFRLVYELT